MAPTAPVGLQELNGWHRAQHSRSQTWRNQKEMPASIPATPKDLERRCPDPLADRSLSLVPDVPECPTLPAYCALPISPVPRVSSGVCSGAQKGPEGPFARLPLLDWAQDISRNRRLGDRNLGSQRMTIMAKSEAL
jgi:hypothetical protein